MSQLFFKTKEVAYTLTQSVNLLLYSQLFSNAAWSATSATLTSGQIDPTGGTTAFTMTATGANATVLQALTGLTSANRVFSIYVKRKTGTGAVSITTDGTNYATITTTGTWTRFEATRATSGSVNVGIKLATSGDEVYIAWAQYELGSTASTYTQTTSSPYTITQVTDPDYPANTCRGAAYLDGTFYVLSPDGTINGSNIEDSQSWNALNFIQAIIKPGAGVFITNYQSYVMVLKEWSTEFFYDAGNPAPGSPLGPVPSMAFSIGCASEDSVQTPVGTVVWMSQTEDGKGRGIYRLNGTAPEKISTPSVEKILDADDLANVKSWNAKVGSRILYGISLGTVAKTLVYDFSTSLWTFWTYLETSGAAKTVTAVSSTGVVTSTAHGYSDGDIVNISGTTTFDGFAVVTNVTANTFTIQTTGTAFSGSGSVQKYIEGVFPIIASTSSGGVQYMQADTSGALYTLDQNSYKDPIGAIAARIRTSKWDGGTANWKRISSTEFIGDKIDSYCLIRKTDDDYQTYSGFRPINMNATRSWIKGCGRTSRRAWEVLHVEDSLFRGESLEIEME